MPKPILILQHYWCETPEVFLMIQTWLKAFADELTSACSYVDPAAIEHEIATRTIRMNVLAREFMRRFCEML